MVDCHLPAVRESTDLAVVGESPTLALHDVLTFLREQMLIGIENAAEEFRARAQEGDAATQVALVTQVRAKKLSFENDLVNEISEIRNLARDFKTRREADPVSIARLNQTMKETGRVVLAALKKLEDEFCGE